jgi:hypothetical protein
MGGYKRSNEGVKKNKKQKTKKKIELNKNDKNGQYGVR